MKKLYAHKVKALEVGKSEEFLISDIFNLDADPAIAKTQVQQKINSIRVTCCQIANREGKKFSIKSSPETTRILITRKA